jgi:hypothetical protein
MTGIRVRRSVGRRCRIKASNGSLPLRALAHGDPANSRAPELPPSSAAAIITASRLRHGAILLDVGAHALRGHSA